MLSEEALEKLSERLVDRIESLNTYFIKKIGKQIKTIGTITPSQLSELLQSVQYGNDIDEIMNKIAEITDMNVKDIYKIFEEVAKKNQLFSKKFYDYKKIKFIPYEKNNILQEQVRTIAKVTADEYINLSKTFAYMNISSTGTKKFTSISDIYQKITDEAILSVTQGRESYQMAMQKAMKEMTNNGLRTVDYSSGYSRRADSSIRMNIMDGIRRLNRELQEEFGKEFGADGVEISHHKNAAPDHIDTIDGRQFSTKGEVTINNTKYENYDTVNNSLKRHVGELNCYHFPMQIVLGVSEPIYSKEQLEADKQANMNGFEGTQLQRKLETKIRQYKDRQIGAKSIDDTDEVYHCQEKIRQLTDKYYDLHKISGLPTKIDRLRVDGYSKIDISNKDNLSSSVKANNDNKINKKLIGNIKDRTVDIEIEKYEDQIFKNKKETAIIIEEIGNVYRFDGVNNYVNIDCNYRNATITHNHPTFDDEIGGSFGKDDFMFVVKHSEIKELRAVDEEYCYIMRPLKKIIENDYNNAYRNVKFIDNDYKHCVMSELREKGLIYYERKPRKRIK